MKQAGSKSTSDGGAGGPEQEDDDGQKQRLRRHVRGEGLEGDWQMLSMMYSPPLSMVGNSALSVLEKAWAVAVGVQGTDMILATGDTVILTENDSNDSKTTV